MDKEILVLLEKGREHYESREFDKAEICLLRVAQAEQGFADVMNMLGVINHDKAEINQAQDYFEKAFKINPRYTEAALNLVVVYNELGRYDDARRIHEHVTSIRPTESQETDPYARGKLANMHADIGRAYAELGLADKAVQQYREALDLCPQFIDIRTRLGQTLKDAGRLDEAVAEFLEVKKTRPNYLPARIFLGVTHFTMGDNKMARNEWEEALEIDPENRTVAMYFRMANQMIAQEDAEKAGVALEVENINGRPTLAPTGDEKEKELSFEHQGERTSLSSANPQSPDDDKNSN